MQFLRIIIISILVSLSFSYIIMSLNIYFSSDSVMAGSDLLEEVMIAIVLVVIIYGMSWWLFNVLLKKDVDEINRIIQKRRGELK